MEILEEKNTIPIGKISLDNFNSKQMLQKND